MMKHVAYAAASTLTVAGWVFPHHIWFSFSLLICKRLSQGRCIALDANTKVWR